MSEYKICAPGRLATACEFYRILCTYNRRRELYRLMAWAKRKRLPGPLRLYGRRLADEEHRLFLARLQSPRASALAYFVNQLAGMLFPPPRYPARGSARGYRYGGA